MIFNRYEAIVLGVCAFLVVGFVAVVIPRIDLALDVFDHFIGGMK